MDNNDNELLIIYKKNSMFSHYLKKLFDEPGDFIKKGIINREIIIDTIGDDYNVVYSVKLDIEKVTDLLTQECLGFSIREMRDMILKKKTVENKEDLTS